MEHKILMGRQAWLRLAGSACGLALAAGSVAHAQTAAVGSAPSGGEVVVDEIVVTAQKRTQVLRDIPQSISVVGGETLERQQANNFQDYLGLIPGLSLEESTPGQSRVVLRGINTGSVSATVAVYVDETPFGSSSGLVNGGILAGDFDTFDIARVEVLRGPQGTLYGASSLGGVLKFVTNAPELGMLEGRGRVGVETVEGGDVGYSTQGVLNVPLGDSFAVRASGFYRKEAGFIDAIGTVGSDVESNINDAEIYGGRVSALFEPSDRVSFRATAILQDIDANESSSFEADQTTYAPLYGRMTQTRFIPEYTKTRYRLYNGLAEVDLGFANLTSSTSYNTLDRDVLVDNTFVLGSLIDALFGISAGVQRHDVNDIRKFTQEVRLSSPSNERFEWLVGGYYTRETGAIQQVLTATDPATDEILPPSTVPLIADVTLDSVYKEYAGFANATWHVLPRFDLTFGGRYSHNKQSADQQIISPVLGDSLYPTARSSENVFTYSVAPRFELSDSASIYARVAKGYRPGGPNVVLPPLPPGTPLTYDSDSLVSYEAGLKADWLDRTLSVDVSAFYLDWSDIQLFAIVEGVGFNANGGTAVSKGFEGTATLRPTDGLSVTINAAHTDAYLTEDTDPATGGMKGDALPFTPKWSASVSGDYEWSLTDNLTAYAGASLRFVGEQSADFEYAYRVEFGRQRQLPAYEVVDLRAGVSAGRWSLDAYVKNLANKRGYTSAGGAGDLPNDAINVSVIRPRTIGLSLTAGF